MLKTEVKAAPKEEIVPGKSVTDEPVAPKYVGRMVHSGEFEAEAHFYPRVLNAHIHPLVASFFSLGNKRILARYCHLNPQVNEETLRLLLAFSPKYFHWAGADLFNVTTAEGKRQMIVVETNSCPSGQKSMPIVDEVGNDCGGYKLVAEYASHESFAKADPKLGGLAVIFDKNPMEATGYAAVLADTTGEPVWIAEYYSEDKNPPVKWEDGVMFVRDAENVWHSIRACFRYVTQKPWNRFPIKPRTIVIVACLAGGRNKAMASRAYDFFNAEYISSGLQVRIPETIRNVTKSEIPLWVDSMGGHAVLKVPYSNAGQGVYTITSKQELDLFMAEHHHYDKFIVQSLVGNASWSSTTQAGKFYHVGTIPNKKDNTYVVDLRMMIVADKYGFRPVACYARKARKPLMKNLADNTSGDSWDMLGTNLSIKGPDGTWGTEPSRLLLMDRKDFNQLGIGIDDLIDAYIQTVLSVISIDKLAQKLMKEGAEYGTFDYELFEALNPDPALLAEIKAGPSSFY